MLSVIVKAKERTDSRASMVRGAVSLIRTRGVNATSLSEVLAESGAPRGSIYHHFGDKDGLLAAVVDFEWARFLETKRAVAAVAHEHVADDIRAGWNNHIDFARENPNSPPSGRRSSSFSRSRASRAWPIARRATSASPSRAAARPYLR